MKRNDMEPDETWTWKFHWEVTNVKPSNVQLTESSIVVTKTKRLKKKKKKKKKKKMMMMKKKKKKKECDRESQGL